MTPEVPADPDEPARIKRAIHAAAGMADRLGSEAFERGEDAYAKTLYGVAIRIRDLANPPVYDESNDTAALAMAEDIVACVLKALDQHDRPKPDDHFPACGTAFPVSRHRMKEWLAAVRSRTP